LYCSFAKHFPAPETSMTRAPLAALGAALLLCACAKDGGRSSAAGSDSLATAAPAPAPSGMMGAPAVAQKGVDSSNAAQQQRLDEVNQLSEQAGGPPQPQP
jgi:hypothetical protein